MRLLVALCVAAVALVRASNDIDQRVPRLQGLSKGEGWVIEGRLQRTVTKPARFEILNSYAQKVLVGVVLNENNGNVRLYSTYSPDQDHETAVKVKRGADFKLIISATNDELFSVLLDDQLIGTVKAPIRKVRTVRAAGSVTVKKQYVDFNLRQPLFRPLNLKEGDVLKVQMSLGHEWIEMGFVDAEDFIPFYVSLRPEEYLITFNNDNGKYGTEERKYLADDIAPGKVVDLYFANTKHGIEVKANDKDVILFKHRTKFPNADYKQVVISDAGDGYLVHADVQRP